MNQAEIDRQNREFWDELCGTYLARRLGINDFSAESLAKFDRHFLETYPYLPPYLQLEVCRGKDVLEVGLGYGTVSQLLAGKARRYTGLDIAAGPVAIVNQRMALFNLPGSAQPGSILDAPFADASFDVVVTIGCLHHTGDLQRAVDEVHRVLRAGGFALVMIYNGLSYRRWWKSPAATARMWFNDYLGRSAAMATSAAERGAYDRSSSGASAPETVFTSRRRLRRICARFSNVSIRKENADQEPPFRRFSRNALLPTIGPRLGLDLYATLIK